MNKFENKSLELQALSRSTQSQSSVDLDVHDEAVEETVYYPNPLESLSSKVEDCLKKQRELNFLAREVSSVLKKLK